MASGHAWKLEYNWNVFFRLARSLTVRLEPGEDLAFATTEQQYEEIFLVPFISQLLYLELCFFFLLPFFRYETNLPLTSR